MFQCVPQFMSQIGGAEAGLLLTLFLGGITGGFMHCSLMCGPFVLALQQGQIGKLSQSLLLPYHLGRLVTYTGLGVLANVFLNAAFVSSPLRHLVSAGFLSLAGLVFLAQALPVFYRYLPFLARITIPVPLSLIERGAQFLTRDATTMKTFALGLLLGFMPCGLVMASLLAVSAAPNFWLAGLGMAGFSLGTVPALVLVAMGGKALATIYPTTMRVLSQGLVVINGFILLVLAGKLLT